MTQSTSENDIPHSYRMKGNLREGSITGHLTRLTIPMIWGIAAIISFQLADMYFIAQLGTEYLAAITFTFPFTYIFLTVLIGFSIAISSIISRLIGENREQEYIQKKTTHAILLVFIFSIALAYVGFLIQGSVFRTMGANDGFISIIGEYMSVWFISVPLLAIPMTGNSALRASGNALVPAVVMTLIALVNIILDPLLIFGLYGFPELGVQGAAWATVIADGVATVIGLFIYLRVHPVIALRWFVHLQGFWRTTKQVLIIALPVGLTQTIHPLINAVIITLLAKIGTDAVAAMGVVSRVEAFFFVVLMALSTGMAPIIGQNFGSRDYGRVTETLRKVIGFSVGWSLVVALVLATTGSLIAGLFTNDEEVIRLTQIFFWIVPFSYAFAHLVMGWSSAFNAMGMPQRSLLMIVVKMLVLMLPAVYIGSLYGIVGIFSAIAIVNIVAGVFFHFWSKRFLSFHVTATQMASIEP